MLLSLYRPLLTLLRLERLALARFAVAAVLGAGLPMVSILLLHQFLSGILGVQEGLAATVTRAIGAAAAIWLLAGLLFLTFLLTAAVRFHNVVVQQRLVRSIELGVMERLLRHLLTLSVLMLDKQSPGDIIEAVREDISKLRTIIESCARLAFACLTAIALIGAAIWLSPALAMVSFPILLLAAWPAITLSRRVRRRAGGMRRRAYRAFDVVLEMLRGVRVIKIYSGENAEAGRAVAQMRGYFAELIELARAQAMGSVLMESLGGLSVVVVVIVGGFEVLSGRLTWPSLLAFLLAVRSAQGPLLEISTHLLNVQRHIPAAQRLEELLKLKSNPCDTPDSRPLDGPITSVRFDHVSFAYEAGPPVIKHVSFAVSQGEVLGIVGPSAAGKTTLLNLAIRFFDPTSGTVLINNSDARTFRLADLYGQAAIVTQEPFLFSTTVRENIRCGRSDASDEEVEAAARAAEIHQDILALPCGYDTCVGTGNRGLSGGQIQRLNIARALLKNAPLLLLDEATSSLDSVAESRIRRALARLMQGRTTLVVAHRLSTLNHATRIVVLEHGRMVALGTHDELVDGCPLYRRMWDAQTTRERSEPAGVTVAAHRA